MWLPFILLPILFGCVFETSEATSYYPRGRWGNWSNWSSCNNKVQSRYRRCIQQPCSGPTRQTRACCSYSTWRNWSVWGRCSKPCGSGVQYRTRTCSRNCPNKPCQGQVTRQSRRCNPQPCCQYSAWGDWGVWGRCSKTCGSGVQYRARTCRRNCPNKPCQGQAPRQSRRCNPQPCCQSSSWGDWNAWGRCDKTCGGGKQARTRPCRNNCPGKPCSGGPGASQTRSCNPQPCCQSSWTSWCKWSDCQGDCNKTGTKKRTRTCRGVGHCTPTYCPGPSEQTASCRKYCPYY